MKRMTGRRFVLLAAALAALNVVLWLAPPGLALRQALINQLFGPRLIRAEVVATAGRGTRDYLIDRGAIIAVTPTGITLRERDGKVQPIRLDTRTTVSGKKRFDSVGSLRRGLQVLVVREANGAATSVVVEAVTTANAAGRGKPHPVP